MCNCQSVGPAPIYQEEPALPVHMTHVKSASTFVHSTVCNIDSLHLASRPQPLGKGFSFPPKGLCVMGTGTPLILEKRAAHEIDDCSGA